MKQERGAHVVLMGGDGCGKGTQIKLLEGFFKRSGREVICVQEPDRLGFLGPQIDDVLYKRATTSKEALQIAFTANGIDLLDRTVRPAIFAGINVLEDRGRFCTVAYGEAGGMNGEMLWLIQKTFAYRNDLSPFFVFMKVDPEIGLARVGKRSEEKSIFDGRVDFQRKVNAVYSRYCLGELADTSCIVDANGGIDETQEKIVKELQSRGIV